MCLVEIEGIPKLQTACSTPVKDGMVVHTQTDRVQEAQRAVVEFLLINHPLDCPVCDKGGECPLQDITFGWGPGVSRYIEPKRHFEKPLELSPLIAIDRERCILCYRCVRFSQEVSEDNQLILAERGANTFVSTFDSHPYVAPFSGNITELCPVGALTSIPYRFKARPWDIEQAGTVCTLCPAQCNVSLTVRDDKTLRVLGRDHEGVDDGWLCDKGRYAFQSFQADERITTPLVREGGELRPSSWEHALTSATNALAKAKSKTAALAQGATTNEEGFLLGRLLRETLGSPHLDSRTSSEVELELLQALSEPQLQASVPDIEYAHAVLVLGCEPLDDAPVIDLRIRKGVRHRITQLAVATSLPSSLDRGAKLVARYAPGMEANFISALDCVLSGADYEQFATGAGADPKQVRALGELLYEAGEDVVIVWGERVGHGGHGNQALRGLLNLTHRLNLAGNEGAGLLELPASANGRGLREVGVLPNAQGGLTPVANDGKAAHAMAHALADGELTALYLINADPLRTMPDRELWQRALAKAGTVIAHAAFLDETTRQYADVVFPAQVYAEQEGTVTHPDGRVQRLRPAVGNRGSVRAGWQVLAELSRRLGNDLKLPTYAAVNATLFEAVPFYQGLTLAELGGRGVRWPQRDEAAQLPQPAKKAPFTLKQLPSAPSARGALRLGSFRPLWATAEVEASPSLKFATVEQEAQLAPADAKRLKLQAGDLIVLSANGTDVQAKVTLRSGIPNGTVFLAQATRENNATALLGLEPTLVKIDKVQQH
jgi:NADH-quinone oxidoreductase subunit G